MTPLRKIQALALALAVLAASVIAIAGSQGAEAQPSPTTTQDFVGLAAPTHFKVGIGTVTRSEAVSMAQSHDLLIAHWYTFRGHINAMKSANPDVTILAYQKGATAPDDAGSKYPDSWYLRNASGNKVRSDPWGSYLMDPRKVGWRNTVVADCESEIDRSDYDGCYFDVMGTGALSILSSQPVISDGGPEITREQWHTMMETLASHVRSNIAASTPLMSNSLTAGRRYFDDRYPSAELGNAMGQSHAEVWQRTAYKDANAFRTMQEYRWELEMLTDAADRDVPILLTTKLWVPVSETRRSQWRQMSYASFLLASDGSHFWAFTGQKSDIELEHPLYDLDIGVPTNDYRELAGGVFKRNFTNGIVLSNGEVTNRSVSLPSGTFVDYEGNTYSGTALVKANSGLVLKKQGGAAPTPTPVPPTPTPVPPPGPTPTPTPDPGPPAGGLKCQGALVTIEGTSDADVIVGTPGRDVIHGRSGADDIRGLGGNDIICGGPGNDEIRGGEGDDKLYGDNGQDKLYGDPGNDRLRGGDADDELNGGIGNDDLRGNEGDDMLYGNDGADVLNGRSGNDRCFGGSGTDTAEFCEERDSAAPV